MTTATPDAPETPKPTTKSRWKKAKRHDGVTLPSGEVVAIELPNLANLIKAGTIPNQLIDSALELQQKRKVNRDDLLANWEFTKLIVPLTVVEPEIAPEDVDDLPIEDVELVGQFATRSTDIDAVGHHLGGLETQKSFRSHRGFVSLDEALANIQGG